MPSSNSIRAERLAAAMDGEFVVFLIGMRINKPLLVHKWWPVAQAMPRMLRELYRKPELGFLSGEMWFSRTILVLQYWRSMEQLMAYATNKQAEHLPAWRSFNKSVGTDGTVGVWHETYAASAGSYETIYVNMPAFGLGKAGTLHPASGQRHTAPGRLGRTSDGARGPGED
jgi:hypothetical protein